MTAQTAFGQASAGHAVAGPGGLDYEGRRFRPADHPPGADPPVGLYHQAGDLVWAEFSGGTVRAGRLVGRCRPDSVIEAAYCMLTAGGETVAGDCLSVPTVLADGRVRLAEHWRRLDGTRGVSHVEQVEQVEDAGTGEDGESTA